MPVYPPPLSAPLLLVADTSDPNAGSAAALTASRIYFGPMTLYAPVMVTQMRCFFSGAVTGNCDMGIYDSTGPNGVPNNLLAHTGAIAAVTGLFTQNLTANLLLFPGRYWLAWLDTVADSIQKAGGVAAGISPFYVSNSTFTVLPNPLTGGVADTPNRVTLLALVSGGYS